MRHDRAPDPSRNRFGPATPLPKHPHVLARTSVALLRRRGSDAPHPQQGEVGTPVNADNPRARPTHLHCPAKHMRDRNNAVISNPEARCDLGAGCNTQGRDRGSTRRRRVVREDERTGEDEVGKKARAEDGQAAAGRTAAAGRRRAPMAAAVRPRNHGGGPELERATSVGSTRRTSRVWRPSTRSSRSSRAVLPISGRGWLMVVSDMWWRAARKVLS